MGFAVGVCPESSPEVALDQLFHYHSCFENDFSIISLHGHDGEIKLRERLSLLDKLINVSCCISLNNHIGTYERKNT